MSAFIEELRRRAGARRRRIVFAEGADDRTAAAVAFLQGEGLVEPVVLGPPESVRRAIDDAGGDGSAVDVFDPFRDARRDDFAAELFARRRHRGTTKAEALERVADPLIFAALLVRHGDACGSVAGAQRTTGEVVRAGVWCVGPAPGLRTISSSFYMVVPAFRGGGAEVLTFTDAGVLPDPNARQLAEVARAAAEARRRIVGDEPRVAFLSYSTKGSAEGASVTKMREALARFREAAADTEADGELQADAALIREVALRKAPDSVVAGRANVLVFPDLDAANIAYKLVHRLAGADAIGPILQGLDRPCNDVSRGASTDDIVNVACVTALQVHER